MSVIAGKQEHEWDGGPATQLTCSPRDYQADVIDATERLCENEVERVALDSKSVVDDGFAFTGYVPHSCAESQVVRPQAHVVDTIETSDDTLGVVTHLTHSHNQAVFVQEDPVGHYSVSRSARSFY